MSRQLGLLTMAALATVGLMLGSVQAQERATIQALATVVSSLNIVGTNNLQFGTVTPGVNKSVDKATVGFAGEWTITGTAGAELSIAFTLPDSMSTADSLAFMRIIFTATDASWDDGTGGGQTSPVGVVDPAGPSVLDLGAGGTLMMWIGGTVVPRVSQTGGDYSGDITLTVAYTGS